MVEKNKIGVTPLFLGRMTWNLVGEYIGVVCMFMYFFQVPTCYIFANIAKKVFFGK